MSLEVFCTIEQLFAIFRMVRALILKLKIYYRLGNKGFGTFRRAAIIVILDSSDAFETIRFATWSLTLSHVLSEFITDEAFILLHGLAIGYVFPGDEFCHPTSK